ncbi:cyclase [Synechococcales cyanobacterium C]|uniref:Cyclase n=2 Tax=Petrachloros TaxID=2918834 RepID=A0A8K2A734_9CYAN|nr:cyclase [Petrachloros mirabilis ULC683]
MALNPLATDPQPATSEPTTEAEADLETVESLSDQVSLWLQKREGRQRYIEAKLLLPHAPEKVWQVLTDYERLADFIPNLAKSKCLPSEEGCILLEQVGVQDALFLKFSARVVLEMQEQFPHTLGFTMVEGDFTAFEGGWRLRSLPLGHAQDPGTELTYAVQVHPKRTMPVIAVERRLRKDLPNNLMAIRDRLATLYPLNELSAAEPQD